eukprot:1160441-Pelagomonas_calceolata.AAC.1
MNARSWPQGRAQSRPLAFIAHVCLRAHCPAITDRSFAPPSSSASQFVARACFALPSVELSRILNASYQGQDFGSTTLLLRGGGLKAHDANVDGCIF